MTHRSALPYNAAAVLLAVGGLGVLAVACTAGVLVCCTIEGVWKLSDAVHRWRSPASSRGTRRAGR